MGKTSGLLSNLTWKFAERITAQLVTLVVSIVLARLLEPAHYGIISIVMIFITLANVFVSDGLGTALIQKKDADSLDFSSVLYTNIALSIILYSVLFIFAPWISAFYGEGYEILTPVLRVLGLRLILSAINSVQQAYVAKKMIFKKFFWATLFGTVLSAFVGIYMAYNGYGVWAIVGQYLTNTTVDTVFLAFSLHVMPGFKYSFQRVKQLFGFGFRMLLSGLLINGYMELRSLIIGKLYSSADLAYFDKAKQFPQVIGTNINTSVGAVLFPKMANEQDDLSAVRQTTRNSIRFSAYVMSPLMLGFAAISNTFVRLILTDKWLPCVPLMQLFCIVYLFQPIHTANMQAIKAIGRSDIYLRLEIIKKTIELIILVISVQISVEAVVVGMAICTTLFTVVNAFPNAHLLNYSFKDQIKDLIPSLSIALIMFLITLLIGKLPFGSFWVMVIQIVSGTIIYAILSVVTKNKEFHYLLSILKNKRRIKN
jgi:O-antigen/teichoic acid export membrane protein